MVESDDACARARARRLPATALRLVTTTRLARIGMKQRTEPHSWTLDDDDGHALVYDDDDDDDVRDDASSDSSTSSSSVRDDACR